MTFPRSHSECRAGEHLVRLTIGSARRLPLPALSSHAGHELPQEQGMGTCTEKVQTWARDKTPTQDVGAESTGHTNMHMHACRNMYRCMHMRTHSHLHT